MGVTPDDFLAMCLSILSDDWRCLDSRRTDFHLCFPVYWCSFVVPMHCHLSGDLDHLMMKQAFLVPAASMGMHCPHGLTLNRAQSRWHIEYYFVRVVHIFAL